MYHISIRPIIILSNVIDRGGETEIKHRESLGYTVGCGGEREREREREREKKMIQENLNDRTSSLFLSLFLSLSLSLSLGMCRIKERRGKIDWKGMRRKIRNVKEDGVSIIRELERERERENRERKGGTGVINVNDRG